MGELDEAIEAIAPNAAAAKIHLYVKGYLPPGIGDKRRKQRSVEVTPMCGVYARSSARRVPLAQALRWPERLPTADDTRRQRRWCAACLGHAADYMGMTGELVAAIARNQAVKP